MLLCQWCLAIRLWFLLLRIKAYMSLINCKEEGQSSTFSTYEMMLAIIKRAEDIFLASEVPNTVQKPKYTWRVESKGQNKFASILKIWYVPALLQRKRIRKQKLSEYVNKWMKEPFSWEMFQWAILSRKNFWRKRFND